MRSLKRQRGFIGVGGAILGGTALGIGASIYGAQQQADAANTASSIQQQEFQQIQQQLQPYLQSGNMALSQINQGLFGVAPSFGSPQQQVPSGSGTGFGGHLFGQIAGQAGLSPGSTGTVPQQAGQSASGITPGMFSHQFGLQDFQQSPAYQFNLQQGQMAIDKAANARSNLYAPQTLKDLSSFSQGMASNEFQNAFNNYNTGIGNIWNRLYNVAAGGQNAAAQLGGFGTTTAGEIGQNVIGAGNARAAGTVGAANAFAGGVNQYANMAMINQILAGQQQSGISPSAINNIYGFGASPEF